MKPIKQSAIFTLYHLNFFKMYNFFRKDQVGILVYHRFSDVDVPFRLNHKIFDSQIRFLKNNYNFISLNEYSNYVNGLTEKLPDYSLILTIDDGYEDNYLYAYPILKKYSIPATIFLSTDFVDKRSWLWSNKLEYILKKTAKKVFEFSSTGNKIVKCSVGTFQEWHRTQLLIFNSLRVLPDKERVEELDELAKYLEVKVPEQVADNFIPLSWSQISEMNENKIDFGSHTCSHPILSQLDKKQLKYELRKSKEIITGKLQKEITSFCYPNGKIEDISANVIEAVRKEGYACAVTTILGYNKPKIADPFLLKRLSLSNDQPHLLAKELM